MTLAKKFKFLFFYSLVVLIFSLCVSIFWNGDQTIVRTFQPNYQNYPEVTFFHVTAQDISQLGLPPRSQIKQFRNGPKRHAFYNVDFDPDLLTLKKVDLPRPINIGAHTASKSSPIDSDSFVVLSGDTGLIKILNKADYSLHWTLELFDSNLGIHGTPITFADYMFIGDYSGKLYFLDLLRKEILWVVDLGDALGAAPYFDGQFIYANVELSNPANGFIVKIDPFNKKIIWRSILLGEQSHSTPADFEGSLYFGDNQGDFYRVRKDTGQIAWQKNFDKPIKSTPNLWRELVVFSSWDRKIIALDRKTGSQAWSHPLPNTNQSSMAVDEELGIGFINSSEGIHKVDLSTGKSLGMLKMAMGTGPRKASPVILKFRDKKRVVSACETISVCMFDLNFKIIRKFELSGRISNQAGVLDKSLIFVADQEPILFLLN